MNTRKRADLVGFSSAKSLPHAIISSVKFFRYRRPSLKTLLGVTAAKKRIKKDLGITALLKPVRWWPNKKRQIKRKIGAHSRHQRIKKPMASIGDRVFAFSSDAFDA